MTTPLRAVGIKGAADSLSIIRLAQPLGALSKAEDYELEIRVGNFNVEWGDTPGIFVTYRLHPEREDTWQLIDEKCSQGWIWVHDVDDDPRFLKGQINHKFRSIACAHLVTASTPEIEKICRALNPNVALWPNQIGPLPPKEMVQKVDDGVQRILFGAINRSADWDGGLDYVVDSLIEHGDHIEVFVVNDEKFRARFPKDFPIRLLKHQNYVDYVRLLDHMDITLVPLVDNRFNRSKSDLKIIEALAHGTVPVVSQFAAQQTTVPEEYVFSVEEPADWSRHLNALLDEPKSMVELKGAGHDYIIANRLWSEHVFELDRVYGNALENWKELEQERQIRIDLRKAMGLPA